MHVKVALEDRQLTEHDVLASFAYWLIRESIETRILNRFRSDTDLAPHWPGLWIPRSWLIRSTFQIRLVAIKTLQQVLYLYGQRKTDGDRNDQGISLHSRIHTNWLRLSLLHHKVMLMGLHFYLYQPSCHSPFQSRLLRIVAPYTRSELVILIRDETSLGLNVFCSQHNSRGSGSGMLGQRTMKE